MKLAIGIDTGGTYTDGVIFDQEEGRVLSSAKALTTRQDLSIGIKNALDGLDSTLFDKVQMVALSTTLATNACVENKGGRAKLLFFGIDKRAFDMVGKSYGLGSMSELYFCDKNEVDGFPNENELLSETRDWLCDADGLGIVESFAMKNGAYFEKKAKQVFEGEYDFPVICGHELFSELNSIQRGSTTLLNAKLVPIIKEFISSIKKALSERSIAAPVVIVRSDGSLMSEKYSRIRPVETILSGPAASILGGMRLTDEKESILIDMGGTTTDVSLVKNGVPLSVNSGISIGKWKTFVNGVFIDTFGLGGDSMIRLKEGRLKLYARRVMPLCAAAAQFPQIKEKLSSLAASKKAHTYPLHEFFMLVRDIEGSGNYTAEEQKFCAALKNGPLILDEAAKTIDRDIYSLDVRRLEKEGVVLRCGLTPTDIMHIKGDFNSFDTEASRKAVRFFINCLNKGRETAITEEEFCDKVYDAVKCKLYSNIVRILLCDKYPEFKKDGISPQLKKMIKDSWETAKHAETGFADARFKTSASLVAIGAPTHIFIDDVAKALGTRAVKPENAGVANAVGAVFGNIRAVSYIDIKPLLSSIESTGGYMVFAKEGSYRLDTLKEAVAKATQDARSDAKAEARRRGAAGAIDVRTEVSEFKAQAWGDVDIELGTRVTATAVGKIFY